MSDPLDPIYEDLKAIYDQPLQMTTREIVPPKPWLTYDAPRWMRRVEWWLRVRVCKQTGYLIDKWTVIEDNIEPGNIQIPSNQLDDTV